MSLSLISCFISFFFLMTEKGRLIKQERNGAFYKGLSVSINVFNRCEKVPPDDNVVNPGQCEEKSDIVFGLVILVPFSEGKASLR